MDNLRSKGNLHKGVRLGRGKGILSVRGYDVEDVPDSCDIKSADNQIITTASSSIVKELVFMIENTNKTVLAKIANTGIDISRKIVYTVKAGDNLSEIAKKYQVKVNDIRSWNELNEEHILQPGDKLTITINVVNSNLS